MQPLSEGNHFRPGNLIQRHLVGNDHEAELAMHSRITEDSEPIDRKTSRSICDAVGERLQQHLRPESLLPSSHLDHLMAELRNRDSEASPQSSH
jgi:hypothetical protein